MHTLTSPTAIDISVLRNIEKPCKSVCPYFTVISLLILYTCSVNSVHPPKYIRVQNCPDITILVSHDVSNGAGHGGVGHRIYHGVDHEVGHGVSHEVSQGRGVTSSQSADQMSRESQVLKVTFLSSHRRLLFS